MHRERLDKMFGVMMSDHIVFRTGMWPESEVGTDMKS